MWPFDNRRPKKRQNLDLATACLAVRRIKLKVVGRPWKVSSFGKSLALKLRAWLFEGRALHDFSPPGLKAVHGGHGKTSTRAQAITQTKRSRFFHMRIKLLYGYSTTPCIVEVIAQVPIHSSQFCALIYGHLHMELSQEPL